MFEIVKRVVKQLLLTLSLVFTARLSTIDDIDLARRVTRHIQPPLLVKCQSNWTEATRGACSITSVLHDSNLGRLAVWWLYRLAIGAELNFGDTVSIRGVTIPK